MYYLGINEATAARRTAVVLDGKAVKQVQGEVKSPCFSPDSARFLYAAERDTKWVVCVDEAEQPPVDTVLCPAVGNAFTFDPSG